MIKPTIATIEISDHISAQGYLIETYEDGTALVRTGPNSVARGKLVPTVRDGEVAAR